MTLSHKIANYELGIVFPMKDSAEADKVACWQRPPRKYTTKDEPWVGRRQVFLTRTTLMKQFFLTDTRGICASPIMSALLIRMKRLSF